MISRPEFAPVPQGARLALIAPASPPEPQRIDRAEELLHEWGYEVVPGQHLREHHPVIPYLAGTDEQRAEDLQWALTDPDIDAVLCARGGYGSMRALKYVNNGVISGSDPKPFFGSSDITAVHTWLHKTFGRGSWFSPMPATLAVLDDQVSRHGLHQALCKGLVERGVTEESARRQRGEYAGRRCRGHVRGGNLSLLAQGCARRGAVGFDEATILLLEDVHEAPYCIDGKLCELVSAGFFRGVVGIALGSWHECADLDTIDAIADDVLAPLGIPIASGFDFGHGPAAGTVPLNVPGVLDIRAQGARLVCGAGT